MRNRQRGFTLVELMIVVAIVAILGAIAFPSYMQHVRKTRRAECEGVLTTISAALERAYSVNNGKYPDAATGNKPPNNAPGACPLDGGTTFYNITYATASASQEFTLTATPQNDQVKDVCGTLTLKHTGEKSPTPTTCWK